MGPGENAGAVDVGNGHAVAFKVESHNHPSAVEPFQGAATGRRRHPARRLRARGAADRGARLAALRRALLRALALPARRRGRAGSATTATRSASRRSAARSTSRPPYEHNCLVNAMCVGLARSRRDGPLGRRRPRQPAWCSWAPRPGATGSAAPRCSPRPSWSRGRREAAQRPDRRPVRGVEAARVLPGAARARAAGLAPGPRRRRAHLVGRRDGVGGRRRDRHRRRPGAAPRGGPGAVRGDGLRVAGADAGGGRAPAARRGAGDLRALADRGRGDRRGHRHGIGSGSSRRRRGVGDVPVSALVDECPLYDLEPERARRLDLRRTARRSIARAPAPATSLAGPARPRPTSRRSAGRSSSTTRSSARAPCGGRRRPTRRCCRLPEAGRGDRGRRSTATGGGSPATRTGARSRRCSSAPQNLACVGAEPLGLTNCLNFGNPEKPNVAWQLDRSVQGLADACARARGAGRRRQRLALQRDRAGPIYPTPVVGMVGELPDPERGRGASRSARGRRDRAGRAVRALAGGLGAGEAARGARPPGFRRSRSSRRAGGDRSSCATRCASVRVACRPRRQRRRAGLRAGRVRDRRRGRLRVDLDPLVELRGGSGETACSARGRAGSCSRRAAAKLEATRL